MTILIIINRNKNDQKLFRTYHIWFLLLFRFSSALLRLGSIRHRDDNHGGKVLKAGAPPFHTWQYPHRYGQKKKCSRINTTAP